MTKNEKFRKRRKKCLRLQAQPLFRSISKNVGKTNLVPTPRSAPRTPPLPALGRKRKGGATPLLRREILTRDCKGNCSAGQKDCDSKTNCKTPLTRRTGRRILKNFAPPNDWISLDAQTVNGTEKGFNTGRGAELAAFEALTSVKRVGFSGALVSTALMA